MTRFKMFDFLFHSAEKWSHNSYFRILSELSDWFPSSPKKSGIFFRKIRRESFNLGIFANYCIFTLESNWHRKNFLSNCRRALHFCYISSEYSILKSQQYLGICYIQFFFWLLVEYIEFTGIDFFSTSPHYLFFIFIKGVMETVVLFKYSNLEKCASIS